MGPSGKNQPTLFQRDVRTSVFCSELELPFLPTFNDLQFKVRTRIDAKNEITFIGLGAIDKNELNLDIEEPDESQQYILSQLPENKQWSYSIGGVYKHFEKHSFQTLVVSRSHFNNSAVKYLENDDSFEVNKILDYSSEEMETKYGSKIPRVLVM